MPDKVVKNTKLHELLAVNSNIQNQAAKTRTELTNTFQKKGHLFTSKIVTYKPLAEGQPEEVVEHTEIQTTVPDEISWISKILAKALDAGHQIEVANTQAKADIIIEGQEEPLVKDVPATSLLQLEKRIQEIHSLVVSIPTLDPAKGFQRVEGDKPNYFRARDVKKPRTKKTFVPLVLANATKEHPAQVKEGWEDKAEGETLQQEWSSLVTPDIKAKLLDRCDILARAVKRARSKANEQEFNQQENHVGDTLLNYIFSPLRNS